MWIKVSSFHLLCHSLVIAIMRSCVLLLMACWFFGDEGWADHVFIETHTHTRAHAHTRTRAHTHAHTLLHDRYDPIITSNMHYVNKVNYEYLRHCLYWGVCGWRLVEASEESDWALGPVRLHTCSSMSHQFEPSVLSVVTDTHTQ